MVVFRVLEVLPGLLGVSVLVLLVMPVLDVGRGEMSLFLGWDDFWLKGETSGKDVENT